jgi:hypothetical protein
MENGRTVPAEPAIRLDCSECDGLTDYEERADRAGVYCEDCGKRHARASLTDANTPGVET